jgi:hypothetical protein
VSFLIKKRCSGDAAVYARKPVGASDTQRRTRELNNLPGIRTLADSRQHVVSVDVRGVRTMRRFAALGRQFKMRTRNLLLDKTFRLFEEIGWL